MEKPSAKSIITLTSLISLAASITTIAIVLFYERTMVESGIDYVESIDFIYNPARGMSVEISVPSEMEYIGYRQRKIFEFSRSLQEFSSGAGLGKDSPISNAFLDSLRAMFEMARKRGLQAFCCFSYYGGGDSKPQIEPQTCIVPGCDKGPKCLGGMHTVLYHIEQLSTVMNDYPDVLIFTYSSMLGMWGEQGSNYALDRNNIALVVDKWFECTRDALPHISIHIRVPMTYLVYYNNKYGTKYKDSALHMIPDPPKDSDAYRISIWNDCFHGDFNDMYTFYDRQREIEWLGKIGERFYYGGETPGSSTIRPNNDWNDPVYFDNEAFRSKVSWIRRYSPTTKEDGQWANQEYRGCDPVYYGRVTLQEYIERHLGYRFVVRSSKVQSVVRSKGTFRVTGIIENVGYANILIAYSAKLLIVCNNDTIIHNASVQIDLNSHKYDITIQLPELANGKYDVYLKINKYSGEGFEEYDDKNPVKFANRNIFNEGLLQANRLGSFVIGPKVKVEPTPSSSESPLAEGIMFPRDQTYLTLKPGDIYDYKPFVRSNGKRYTISWGLERHTTNIAISKDGRLVIGKNVTGVDEYSSYSVKVTASALGQTAISFVKIERNIYYLTDNKTEAVLDQYHPYTFNDLNPLVVKVRNVGANPLKYPTFAYMTGENIDSFEKLTLIWYDTEWDLKVPFRTFIVQPKKNLTKGTYKGVVSVYGAGGETITRIGIRATNFRVSFTVP